MKTYTAEETKNYFDARKAKALKPGEHYAIDGCPGLRMKAMLTKKTWVYRHKSPFDGKLKQVRIGSWPINERGTPPIRFEIGLMSRLSYPTCEIEMNKGRIGSHLEACSGRNEWMPHPNF